MKRVIYVLTAVILGSTSCQKENTSQTEVSDTSTSTTIAVAAVESTDNGSKTTDSVYLVHSCDRESKRDTVAQASLPTNVTTYLTANYTGYTFSKAFVITDSSAATTGYVVIIYYNNKPVGIAFDSSGNFVKVLEQREKGDLSGRGWHHGGRFGNRDGLQKDTIAISDLPAAIQTYLTTNYSNDTIVKAYKNYDSSYVVVLKNNGVFAALFDATGAFIKSVELPSKSGTFQPVALADLPSKVFFYLDTSYPNYVFDKAFSINKEGTVQGFVVLIDANNTKYAIAFDASGNFVQARTIY